IRVSAFRVGIVQLQDVAGCRVRVTFPDRDQMQSWWLPVVVAKTQNDKGYYLPDVGEQVVCLMDRKDEDGAVVGAIYSAVDVPPPAMSADKLHWSAKDGAVFEYDRAKHALAITLPSSGTLNITANGAKISIDASGNVNVVAGGLINLGSGTLIGVARLGDAVTCPAGKGTITSASMKVLAE
ncbi:MAG: phage baseplate assembly protein V, partial [Candidatus Binataceae bacterium]